MSNETNRIDMMEDDDIFDIVELGSVLLHKAWVLVICMLIGAVAAGFITTSLITPQYESASMIYIYNKTTSLTSLTDLQIGSQLAVDFQIVASTREVINKVIEDLGLETTYEDLLQHLEITNPTGSHILKIKATSSDPIQAANISNAVAEELRERIADVMNTDEPSVVERAVVPTKPSSPSLKKNIAIGGVAAAALAAVIIIAAYLMDDTIKTDQDVRKYLHLNTLAAIPQERSARSEGKARKARG